MTNWTRIGGVAAGGLAAIQAAAVIAANAIWDRASARAVARLVQSRQSGNTEHRTFTPGALNGLPEPVARYFTYALSPGQELVRRARFEQRGTFRTRPNGAWSPFTATEHFAVRPPGFVWDATIRMAPLLSVRVRDSYLAGDGAMLGRLAALIPVVRRSGTPEIAAGALARYLAEAPWVPTALLPSAGVTWTAVDDVTARASLTDRGTTVSAEFHFGPRGEIIGNSGLRYRDVNGTGVLTPWVGEFRNYERVHGMMVPREGEVGWTLSEGPFPYWRGRLLELEYEY